MEAMTCNGCGEDATEFREGWCIGCFLERQNRLDEHNARYNWWAKLTEVERDRQIRSVL